MSNLGKISYIRLLKFSRDKKVLMACKFLNINMMRCNVACNVQQLIINYKTCSRHSPV